MSFKVLMHCYEQFYKAWRLKLSITCFSSSDSLTFIENKTTFDCRGPTGCAVASSNTDGKTMTLLFCLMDISAYTMLRHGYMGIYHFCTIQTTFVPDAIAFVLDGYNSETLNTG